MDKVYDQIKREKGRIDIVFTNAGFATLAPLGSITEEHLNNILDTNVKGIVFSVQKALPLIRDGGAIIIQCFHNIDQSHSCIWRLLRNKGRGAFVCP